MPNTQVMQRKTHNGLTALRRKLERLELDHLRQLALAQHEEIETLKAQLDEAREAAYNCARIADMWQRLADEAQDRLDGTGEKLDIGITKEGAIGFVYEH